MASLAPHDPSELGGRFSILWRQKRDHQRLDRLLDELAAAPDASSAPACCAGASVRRPDAPRGEVPSASSAACPTAARREGLTWTR